MNEPHKVVLNLSQWNLGDNQCQQKSEVLYTFMPNKSYAYLLNVEPNHLSNIRQN